MGAQIACVARSGREAGALARRLRRFASGSRVEPFSIAGYLDAENPPSRVVLCPPGGLAEGLAFLERARRRLLWPAPPPRLGMAIGGLRGGEPSTGAADRGPARRGSRSATALLLEGEVGLERARAALAASGPLDWIVEAPGRVRLSARELERLARAGVRWSALEPVRLVAVFAAPALGRAARRRRVLPPGAVVWRRPA